MLNGNHTAYPILENTSLIYSEQESNIGQFVVSTFVKLPTISDYNTKNFVIRIKYIGNALKQAYYQIILIRHKIYYNYHTSNKAPENGLLFKVAIINIAE